MFQVVCPVDTEGEIFTDNQILNQLLTGIIFVTKIVNNKTEDTGKRGSRT